MSVDVVTFGCRLNAYESEVIRGAARGSDGDTIVINSCAVTAEAVRQARQTIRKLKRERPEARIVVTGCAAQTQAADFAAMPEVDRVLGNEEKLDPAAWRGGGKVAVGDIMAAKTLTPHRIASVEGRTRAFVQVQNGCDHRCTFCIIPYGRGNSRSLAVDEVVAQVRAISENGYREVVLTGVDITSYDADGVKLGALVKRILREVPELPRLRLSSIDSVEADADLDRRAGERAAADAASASVFAGGRRSHFEADETAASAGRCDRLLRHDTALAAGCGVRRRYHRGFPDRNRGHVRPLARSGR